jgi:hypothetical protein
MRSQLTVLGVLVGLGLPVIACGGADVGVEDSAGADGSRVGAPENTEDVAEAVSTAPKGFSTVPGFTVGITDDGTKVALSNGNGNVGGKVWQFGTISPATAGKVIETIPDGRVRGISHGGLMVVGQNGALGAVPLAASWSTTAVPEVWKALTLPANTEIIQSVEPRAVDANSDGSIITGWTTLLVSGVHSDRVVVWTNGTPKLLNTLSGPAGQKVSNISRAMSSDGNTVVGYYASGSARPAIWSRASRTAAWTAEAIKNGTKTPYGEAKDVVRSVTTVGTQTTDTTWVVGVATIPNLTTHVVSGGLFRYNITTVTDSVTGITNTTKTYKDLGTCAAGQMDPGNAFVSSDGKIVAGTVCQQMLCTACVWTEAGGMTTMKAYIQAKLGSAPASTYGMTNVWGMSADGKVLAGDLTGMVTTPKSWVVNLP